MIIIITTTTATTTNNNDDDDDDIDNADDDDDDDDDNIIIIMMMMMIMMMMITTTTTTTIIELKGAIRDIYNLRTAPRTVSNTNAQVVRAQLCTNHVQNAEGSSHAACRVPLGTNGQLSY